MKIELNIPKYLHRIKMQTPLIHNITNFVVMSSSANILLALGASPIMAHCYNEIEDITSISNSLVLNIGTLDTEWLKSMVKAAKVANNTKIPIVLDAVGAGASQFRTNSIHKIMNQFKLSVIKGNASEIMAIDSHESAIKTKGVDSTIEVNKIVVESAKKLAISNHCVVAVTGAKDVITDGISVVYVKNGHSIMTKITGMGCGLSAFVSAFCAVSKNIFSATTAGFILYNVCGELASKKYGNKPGSFFAKFLNTIYNAENINLSGLIKSEIE